jgi:hypothetical protein
MKDLIINSKYSLRVSKPWLACKLIKINAQFNTACVWSHMWMKTRKYFIFYSKNLSKYFDFKENNWSLFNSYVKQYDSTINEVILETYLIKREMMAIFIISLTIDLAFVFKWFFILFLGLQQCSIPHSHNLQLSYCLT